MKIAALAASIWLVGLAGCGLAANPQPPTLWLPRPVVDLQAARVGNEVQLRWTMPRHTTDNVELRGLQRARICWMQPQGPSVAFNGQSCRLAGEGNFMPDKPAAFSATLPAELRQGPPRAVTFFVELESPAGKTAGPSNAAWAAAGAAPPAVTGLELQTAPGGVVLHWNGTAPGPGLRMRIERTLIAPPKAPKPSENAGAQPVQEQTLEVDLSHADPGGALDRDAPLDHVYRYTAQRVRIAALPGQSLELAGLPSQPATIDAKEVYPPAVPAGLVAVSDEQAHAIALSWRPDTDPDLAGYVVYRRDLTGAGGWQRVSGPSPIVAPAFDDHNVRTGHRYAYAVSAIDRDGNESARSAQAEEESP